MSGKILSALAVAGLLLSACARPAATPAVTSSGPLTVSGFIEAEEISVAPQGGGRILSIAANVGDEATDGQILVRLDDRIAQAQVSLAEGKVEEARAKLALAQTAVTEADLRVAEATLAQARAGRIGACQAWTDTLAIREDPQAIDRQIAVAQAQLRAADAGRSIAGNYRDIAQSGAEQFWKAQGLLMSAPDRIELYQGGIADAPVDLPQEILDFLNDNPPPDGTYRIGDVEVGIQGGQVIVNYFPDYGMPVNAHFAPNQYWKARVGADSAQAAYDGLRNILGLLYTLRKNPTQTQAQVDQAVARCQEAQALEAMAQAHVDGLHKGATPEEIAALEALYRQAQAELTQAQTTLARQTLTAPTDGIVLARSLEPGELAAPNTVLLILADLDAVYLTLYLPIRDLGRVRLDQAVAVQVDSFPQTTFVGRVTYIGSEAEFPPSNVPQPDDRAGLIFAVRVRIENAEHALRPGVLADAVFEE